jgi:bifunctional non-homologous end joining protein LigD
MKEESISLYFKQGSSDKVYLAHLLEDKGNGLDNLRWRVSFEFGRRGSTLQPGVKIANATYEQAKKVYNKLVGSKVAKGYKPGEGASQAAVVAAGEKESSGLIPWQPTMLEEEEVKTYIKNDNWLAQEKFDGRHLMISSVGGQITASNKKGIVVGFPSEIRDAIAALPVPVILDGEAIGTVLNVFDLIYAGTHNLTGLSTVFRLSMLAELAVRFDEHLKEVYTAYTTAEKRSLFNEIKARRGEGLVFKKKEATYQAGKPNSGGTMRKFKFYGEATCQVLDTTKDKRSVLLGILLDKGGMFREVGKVTIPPNWEMPYKQQLIDVKYLYAYPNGSLFQAIYKGPRDDVDHADYYSSLKFKAGTLEDDDGA